MQKILKTGVLFVFIFAGVAVFSLRIQAVLSDEHKLVTSDKNSAHDLFQKNCARCHGADGKSETELGKLFDASDLTSKDVQKMSRKRMTNSISNGKGGMPAFKKKLNLREIAALVNYVRSLK